MSSFQGSILIFLGLIIIVFFESKTQEFKEDLKNNERLKRNIFYGLFATLTMLFLSFMSEKLRLLVPQVFEGSFLIQVILAFMVGEFLNYLFHYLKHEYDFLWNFHFMHHQESHYNIWLTTHTHFMEVLFSGLIMTSIFVGLGISTHALQIYYVFYALGNSYQHSSLTSNIGSLKYFIVTPEYHKLHHLKGSDCNYGSTLTLFDILFKTADFDTTEKKLSVGFGINDHKPFDFFDETFYFVNDFKKSDTFYRLLEFLSKIPIR